MVIDPWRYFADFWVPSPVTSYSMQKPVIAENSAIAPTNPISVLDMRSVNTNSVKAVVKKRQPKTPRMI